jgi:ADP-ribose pyrophosphatase YjhB (NUDIX family)
VTPKVKAIPQTTFSHQAVSLKGVRIGVAVIVSDLDGRILLERRADCGLWGLPGGRVEPGETVTQSAVREVFEETGLTVEILKLVGVYSDPCDQRLVTYPGEQQALHIVDLVFSGRIFSGELRCSPESERVEFFTIHELPMDIVPPAVAPLEDYIRGHTGIIQ